MDHIFVSDSLLAAGAEYDIVDVNANFVDSPQRASDHNPAIARFTLGGDDAIVGTDGDDTLIGTPGDDTLIGLGGNDTLDALAGNDVLEGGPGDDTLLPGNGTDIVDGGEGNDTADFSTVSFPVTVDLSAGTASYFSTATPGAVTVLVENLTPGGLAGALITPLWVAFQDGSFDLFDLGSLLPPV
ncbi:MAG: hypothetical protein HC890_17630 [Chloroflexaceae bacterium]|nr:hypothetical protein [Chloroflexaceae bacterium]